TRIGRSPARTSPTENCGHQKPEKSPPLSKLAKLAEACECSVADLVSGIGRTSDAATADPNAALTGTTVPGAVLDTPGHAHSPDTEPLVAILAAHATGNHPPQRQASGSAARRSGVAARSTSALGGFVRPLTGRPTGLG